MSDSKPKVLLFDIGGVCVSDQGAFVYYTVIIGFSTSYSVNYLEWTCIESHCVCIADLFRLYRLSKPSLIMS